MTAQNIQKNTTPDTGGANSIGMGSKISQIKPKERNKNPMLDKS
jgi:hypothetical protein